MARGKKENKGNGANIGFENKLWQAADALRNNMDAAIAANLKEFGYGG